MINVMLDPLPTEWNGHKINTDFRIGIQINLALDDVALNKYEKMDVVAELLFSTEEETSTEIYIPTQEEFEQCLEWFLIGWNHDKQIRSKENKRLIDYDVDQWRIYADFLKIYHIDLSMVDMHWWTFNGLLWNMPYKQSAFMEVIDIRRKKINSKMSNAERDAIQKAQKVYGLEQQEDKEFSEEEKSKIDDYDQMMANMRKRKQEEQEALEIFRG